MLIRVKDLIKDYAEGEVVTHVLRGLSFEIKKESLFLLWGHLAQENQH